MLLQDDIDACYGLMHYTWFYGNVCRNVADNNFGEDVVAEMQG